MDGHAGSQILTWQSHVIMAAKCKHDFKKEWLQKVMGSNQETASFFHKPRVI